MKVTIIDNEIYLAQSISSKLNRHGFETEHFSTYAQAFKESTGDIYLVSNDIPREKSRLLIKKFKDKIIILIINVYDAMNLKKAFSYGINDYIVKPFHFDELIGKIRHHQEFFDLKTSINTYQSYLSHSFRDFVKRGKDQELTFPLVIESDSTIYIDKWVFEYSQQYKKLFTFVPIIGNKWQKKIRETDDSDLLYIKNVRYLSKKEKVELLSLLQGKKFILSTILPLESDYKTIKLTIDVHDYDGSEIMNIERYIQFIILKYQYQFPDTVLSKKLGFSRKSLYERRLKYDIRKIKKISTTKG